MNIFQTFFPLGLLLVVALCGGWLIPHYREERARRRRRKLLGPPGAYRDAYADIEVVIASHRESLEAAMDAATKAMRAAYSAKKEIRTANRELEDLAEREQQQHRQAS
jgi:hypothetical protein